MITVKYWCDGGVLGKNPSPRGVYWSLLCEVKGAVELKGPRIIRKGSEEYHTNNDAEWLALREALRHARSYWREAASITIHSDSLIVCNQFNGVWRARVGRHHRLRSECRRISEALKDVTVEWRPRKQLYARLGH
jgi:ribonuclease HI